MESSGRRAARPGRVLIVDDDAEMRRMLADFLEGEGFLVTQAADAAEAIDRLRDGPFEGVVLDKNLPDVSGLDLLPALRHALPETPIVVITAFGDARTHDAAFSRGVYELLLKPFALEELLETLRRMQEHAKAYSPGD